VEFRRYNSAGRYGRIESFDRRNELDVSGLHGALFPSVQNLLHSLTNEAVTIGDGAAAPSEHEVELGELPLELGRSCFKKVGACEGKVTRLARSARRKSARLISSSVDSGAGAILFRF
jgi:hypothetical protein